MVDLTECKWVVWDNDTDTQTLPNRNCRPSAVMSTLAAILWVWRCAVVEVAATDAKFQFEKLLDRVSLGEVIVITRDGKPVAEIMPAQGALQPMGPLRIETDRERESRLDAAPAAIETLSRKYASSGITLQEIHDWINEGRP